MKKYILILGIFSLFSFEAIDITEIEKLKNSYSFVVCKYSQCQATAKSTGMQCKHCVSKAGDYYCWQHD